MDLQMPEMNGVDAMIADSRGISRSPIIVLTTYTGDGRSCGRSRLARGLSA